LVRTPENRIDPLVAVFVLLCSLLHGTVDWFLVEIQGFEANLRWFLQTEMLTQDLISGMNNTAC
jgi:hypothetical protein